MKILLPIIISATMSFGVVQAQETATEKAKDVAEDTAETTKKAAKTVAKAPKKIANAVRDANAQKVNVNMRDYQFAMQSTARPGLTTFVIKNAGRKEHTFAIKGEGVDQKLTPNLKPGQSATMQVDLKPGTYNITCPVDFHTMRGMKTTLTVSR